MTNRERVLPVFLGVFLLALTLSSLVSFSSAEEEAPTIISGVNARISASGTGKIENTSIFSIVAGPGASLWISNEYSDEQYKVSLFVDGGEISSTGLESASRIQEASFLLPEKENYAGKKIEIILLKDGRIVDRALVTYCGDGVCSKGERATTCPPDCRLAGLAPQQASKKTPYLAAGALLIGLAGFVLYIVTTRKRQGL
ncbi:MAG: hypothetical protein V1820_00530 [archaeon]